MNASWKDRLPLALAAGLVVVVVIALAHLQPARAEADRDAVGPHPRYSVIETEGHNLIVTDNRTSTLYFYTIDKDKKVGTELKLRGTIDLKQVGQKVIKPMSAKAEK